VEAGGPGELLWAKLRLYAVAVGGFVVGVVCAAGVAFLTLQVVGERDAVSIAVPAGIGAFMVGTVLGILGSLRLTSKWVSTPDSGSPGFVLHEADPPAAPRSTTDEMVRLVREPAKSRLPPAFLLVASFILFLLVTDPEASLTHLLILAGVLAFHEAGHAVAMRGFGYSDVRVFFIPFFGAATSGRRNAGPAWREGIVLLLGPVPGIVLGVALAVAAGDRSSALGYAASTLVMVNGFNLLPVLPLDGGRLFELVIFGRHRVAAAGASLLSAAAFAAMAVAFDAWLLGAVAFFQLTSAWSSWAVGTASASLRTRGVPLPARVEEASQEVVDEVNRSLEPGWGSRTTATRASWIRLVIERAIDARRAPGIAGSIALMAAWLASVVLATVGVALSFAPG
jgi:Zn-dependent protease